MIKVSSGLQYLCSLSEDFFDGLEPREHLLWDILYLVTRGGRWWVVRGVMVLPGCSGVLARGVWVGGAALLDVGVSWCSSITATEGTVTGLITLLSAPHGVKIVLVEASRYPRQEPAQRYAATVTDQKRKYHDIEGVIYQTFPVQYDSYYRSCETDV